MLLKFIICSFVLHVSFYLLYIQYRKDENDSMKTTCILFYSMFWTSFLLGDIVTLFIFIAFFNIFIVFMDFLIEKIYSTIK